MQAPRSEPAHPSVGGSRGYAPEHRTDALALHQNGLGHLATPSTSSLQRWTHHGVGRLQQTGGPAPTSIRGEHQFLLVLCRTIHPFAQADEVSVFIAQHSSNPVLYSRQAISTREQEIGLTRKVGSTTANQAFTPHNLMRARLWWSQPYPVGVLGKPRQHMLDSDEAGLWIDKKKRTYGKSITTVRVRAPGVYGHGEKWTLILTISPCGSKWWRLAKVAGTTIEVYEAHMAAVIAALPSPVTGGQQRYFMHDNLTAHLDARVTNLIEQAGHRVQARPAYRPVWGPTEYAFNQLQCELTNRVNEITDDTTFAAVVTSILTNLTGFDATFVHCGYT